MIWLATLLTLAQASGASGDTLDCEDAQTQAAMNLCAVRDFEAADALLNEQWAETSALMKTLDGEIDRAFDRQPGYFEALLESQRAWLRFRDAQCLVESFIGRGGSMQPMVDSECRAHLTQLRVQQLRELTDNLAPR